MMNSLFRKSFGTLPLFILMITFGSCGEENRKLEEANRKIDSLSDVLTQQKRVTDSLQQLNGETTQDFPVYFGREFEDIENPEEHITSRLQDKSELIPITSVLGGTMEFRRIKVLTDKWILAHYDDGHIEGKSIFRYELKPDRELDFKIIATENRE